jgi:hypothetical protein
MRCALPARRGYDDTWRGCCAQLCSMLLLALVLVLLRSWETRTNDAAGGTHVDAIVPVATVGEGSSTSTTRWPRPPHLLLPAVVACVLFAVHPVHVEAVASVVGRADAMAGCLYVAALLACVRPPRGVRGSFDARDTKLRARARTATYGLQPPRAPSEVPHGWCLHC